MELSKGPIQSRVLQGAGGRERRKPVESQLEVGNAMAGQRSQTACLHGSGLISPILCVLYLDPDLAGAAHDCVWECEASRLKAD